jgi:hypothetical protein
MFGCLRRLGCLVLILIALAAAWYWYARVDEPAAPAGPRRSLWEPVTPGGAERGRAALEMLESPRGPVFVNASAGDIASFIFFSVANRLPQSARDLEAAVIEDRLAVRGVVSLRDLGVGRILGPLASMLSDSDTVLFSGRLSVVETGIGQYRVHELRVQQLRIPSGLIPRVLRQIDPGERPPGVAPDALVLPLPPYVQDIRVGDGAVTLYKHPQ